jgi:hypothetical protein
LNALERLTERAETKDETWYAERLERLGRAIFGELWDDHPEAPVEEREGL